MALVMMCGIPSSGKSTRARELAAAFSDFEVRIVNDDDLGVSQTDYIDRETEKRARSKQMSAVKRLLAPKTIVILDNMTYIKGFRYQLYCEAKAAGVTSCVVYLGTPVERARSVTTWPSDLFEALSYRFEEPNGMTRWDSPLFVVTPEDALPVEEIRQALINRQPPRPNAATQKSAPQATDFLSSLNSTTQQIAKEVLQLHGRSPGATVTLHGRSVQLPYTLTMPQLARIRRNFISVNKQTPMPEERIIEFFIEFLQKQWEIVT